MPTKRCCCDISCLITSDDFDRADSTDCGPDWVEHDGDWEILGGMLNIDEEGLIRNVEVNPINPANQVIRAKIQNYQDGRRYRLIAQCDSSGSGGYYAEWYYVDSSNMYFTIGDGGGAIQTIGPELPVPEGTIIEFTVTGKNQFCMQDNSSRITLCLPPASGDYCALAAGSSAGATFDDFSLSLHRSDIFVCPSCDCDCEGWCIPNNLLATYVNASYCSGLDGWEQHLVNDGPTKFGDGWGSPSETCPTNPGGVANIRLKMVCDGSGTFSGLTLSLEEGGIGTLFYSPDESVSTCHPLSLRFGPYSFGNVSGCFPTTCCGDSPCDPDESLFYIWITPDPSDYDV